MYKEKLIDLLKSDEQVKEAMEKLEFWCKIYFNDIVPHNRIITYNEANKKFSLDWLIPKILFDYEINPRVCKIIWLPLSERFIRMYCLNNKIELSIYWTWYTTFKKRWKPISTIIIDNTKDFDQQDDEVYQKIYEALLELNK